MIDSLRWASHPERLSVLMLWGTAILWSSIGVLVKEVHWNPLAIASVSSAIAACMQILLLKKINFTWSLAQLAGAAAYAINIVLFIAATKLTTSANAVLLQCTSPVFIACFAAWFLKERTSRADWLMVTAVLVGMALFFNDRLDAGQLTGNILAILSGATVAAYTLLLRFQKNGSPVESVILGNVAIAIFCSPAVIGAPFTFNSAIYLLLLGGLGYGLSFVLYCTAVKHVRALDAILITTKEPVLNPLWVYLAVGEKPGPWAVLGGAVVMSAVTLRSILVALGEKQQLCPDLTITKMAADFNSNDESTKSGQLEETAVGMLPRSQC